MFLLMSNQNNENFTKIWSETINAYPAKKHIYVKKHHSVRLIRNLTGPIKRKMWIEPNIVMCDKELIFGTVNNI